MHVSADCVVCKWRYPPFVTLILNKNNICPSTTLQLDVRHLNRWRRHLVNAYEVKAGMVFIAGKTV